MPRTFLIVGGGLAGAKAAEALREQGFDGRLVLLAAEPERPYERPPLSKEYLRGESDRASIHVHEERFYAEHDIELRTGSAATGIDLDASRVTLADGEQLAYDKLLLATGAQARRIPVPGADLDGVHYLRSVADCDALRERLERGGRVVVVGAGWIGSEFAASARQRGLEVTVVDPVALPNQRLFGTEIGTFYRDVHLQHGVTLQLGEGVAAFEGDAAGSVTAVRTDAGHLVEADFVVVGIGVSPCTQLAQDAGLEVDNGILVDAQLQSSAPDVFAAGDVANAWHPLYGERLRVEHWSNALEQGTAVAGAMLGKPTSYEHIPYFFSDQYDVGMEYSGYAPQWDEVVFRGDPAGGEFLAFWLRDGRVAAGMNVNVWDVSDDVRTLIAGRQRITTAELIDPDVPLASLAARSR